MQASWYSGDVFDAVSLGPHRVIVGGREADCGKRPFFDARRTHATEYDAEYATEYATKYGPVRTHAVPINARILKAVHGSSRH